MKINCEHPTFIVNPNLGELIARFKMYQFAGKIYRNELGYMPYFSFDKKRFNAYLKDITIDNYEDNFVIDSVTGVTYPIYLCVPCGHCVLCKEKKINSFVNRIKYESFLYSDKPLFVTLTYSDKWLPSDGLSVRDVQLFFKRFRVNLERHGFRSKIRYVVVGEYGKRTHRAHYHAIIFGLPTTCDVDLRDIQKILNQSWGCGFTLSRTIDMRDTKTAYYTAKYMRKDCQIPDGCTGLFQNSSRRNGGIGCGFFKEQAKSLRKRVVTHPKVMNPWTGLTEDFCWSLYAIDKIYPSEKKFVPLKLRKALKKYSLCKSLQSHLNPELNWLYETNFQLIKDKFGTLVFFPLDLDIRHVPVQFSSWCDLSECEKVIMNYINEDFSQRLDLQKKREFLLSNLTLNQVDVDLAQKVAKIKRKIKHLENLEVL